MIAVVGHRSYKEKKEEEKKAKKEEDEEEKRICVTHRHTDW